ncbi:MAG: hypothetical protein NPIRA01_11180 [Nitrospirales bacterium]|nr:MAG: hypothetical protein NPIRA01_11180 [Nitrospirales bacterium]
MFVFTQRWPFYLCITLLLSLVATTPVFAHGITFKTDFNDPTAGPGTILDQSSISPSRIFQYTENDVYATAIRDLDAESHFHLFGDGLVMAGDSEGVRFTFGGANPTTPFHAFSVDVTELGTVDTLFTPFMGTTAGPSSLIAGTGLFTFDENAWSGISSFTATFGNPLPGETARLVLTDLNVHQAETNPNPVPEPGTLGLFGAGLIGLGLLRYRKKSAGSSSCE